MISRDKQDEVLRLYDEGRTVKDIMQATGIRSTATIYRIVKESRATRTRAGEFRVTVTLPEELKPFVEQQEDFSKWVANLVYKNIEGVNPTPVIENSGGNFAYKNFEGGSGIIENRDATPTETKPDYKNFGGHSATLIGEDEAVFADLTAIYYRNCATIHTTKICTYIDEELVKSLTLATAKDKQLDFDEVAVYNGGALLWLWRPVTGDNGVESLII